MTFQPWTDAGRGASGGIQTRVVVDGLPLFAPTDPFGAYSALNPDAIDAVEVQCVKVSELPRAPRSTPGTEHAPLDTTRLSLVGGAAAVVVVASMAAAAGPARVWIVNGVRTLLRKSAEAPSLPSPARSTVSSSTVTVTFAPEADEVLFWLDATPASGALEMHVVGDGRTTAGIARGPASEEIVVVPNGVHVRNGPAFVADYRVTVGCMGARIRLRVGPAGATRDTVFTAASQFTRIDLRAIRSR